MSAVSEAFHRVPDRRGRVIGILPSRSEGEFVPPAGYPNPWVEIAIQTHLPLSGLAGSQALSRNHLNILSSNVIVALPGNYGTSSEVRLALRYGKPVIAFLREREEIPDLPVEVEVGAFEQVQAFILGVIGPAGHSRNG